jgi:Uma2 family endonuclease
MVAQTNPRARYADIEALAPNLVGEIIAGVLYAHARPAGPHTRAASQLGGELAGPFDRGRGGPGGWIILDEPELHFPNGVDQDVVVPDLAGWKRDRMPTIPSAAFITLAPDWICEVVSASTEAIDRGEKMPVYSRVGVKWAWLVDPEIKTLEVFQLDREAWRVVKTFHGDVKVRAQPFDAIELELAALWEGVEAT